MCTVKTKKPIGSLRFIITPPLTQFLNNRIYMLLRWLHGCFQAGVMYVYVGQPYNYLLQTVGSGENWRLEATRLQV